VTGAPHTTEELERAITRPTRPFWPRMIRRFVMVAILVPVVWAALGLNVSLDRLLTAPGDIFALLVNLSQPDLSARAIQRALPKVMESFFIAWIGTMIGATISFPLAFLAAKNVSSPVVTNPVRQLLNGIRAVPELLVAVALIPVTGSPWASTRSVRSASSHRRSSRASIPGRSRRLPLSAEARSPGCDSPSSPR
jgi:phosphonate transport system permease protein